MTTLYPVHDQFVHLSRLVEKPAHWRALSDDESPWEKTVAEFTGKLMHLTGVPFNYLVPDNRMLPPESIRFFYVDQNWLDALRDGALSLGRIGDMDRQHDQAMTPVISRRAERTALNTRRARLGQETVAEPGTTPAFGGFLMRSAVVSGWPGLEVQAFKASEGSNERTKCTGDKIDLIRMDRLSSDVLLCLFAERFGCVNIHEPKEGINFGAFEAGPDHYTKKLRGLGIGGYELAEFIEDAAVDVPLRSPSSRVVEVNQLRVAMVNKLKSLTPPAWIGSEESFTGAQFSLEMIEGASQHIFRADDSAPPATAKIQRLSSIDERAEDREQLNTFLFGPPNEGTP